MGTEQKNSFIKLAKFLAVFALIELVFGQLAVRLYFSQESGKYARLTQVIDKVDSELIIFGSSHAHRHYVPSVFEDSLHLSTYNAGTLGQKMIFQYALEQLILERHTPKCIVLNLDPEWMIASPENYDRLSALYPYYWSHRSTLQPILAYESPFTDLKTLLPSCRMNSTLVHAMKYTFSSQQDAQGFIPMQGKMSPPKTPKVHLAENQTTMHLDTTCAFALQQFLHSAQQKHIQIFLVFSPTATELDPRWDKSIQHMLRIARAYQVPVFNHLNDPTFTGKYDLFKDPGHLNAEGAALFSAKIASEIKRALHE